MLDADTAAPIGCLKTGAQAGGQRTIVASTIALDEMWTYLGARKAEKRNDLWVWTAVVEERDGSRWMDFEVGGRDEATFLRRCLRAMPWADARPAVS